MFFGCIQHTHTHAIYASWQYIFNVNDLHLPEINQQKREQNVKVNDTPLRVIMISVSIMDYTHTEST